MLLKANMLLLPFFTFRAGFIELLILPKTAANRILPYSQSNFLQSTALFFFFNVLAFLLIWNNLNLQPENNGLTKIFSSTICTLKVDHYKTINQQPFFWYNFLPLDICCQVILSIPQLHFIMSSSSSILASCLCSFYVSAYAHCRSVHMYLYLYL